MLDGHWTDRWRLARQFQHFKEELVITILLFYQCFGCGGTEILIASVGSWLVQSSLQGQFLLNGTMRCLDWFQAIVCLGRLVAPLALRTKRTKSASCKGFFRALNANLLHRSSVSQSLQYPMVGEARHWYWRIPRSHHELSPLNISHNGLNPRAEDCWGRLDLPTLGRPLAVEIPSRRILPRRAVTKLCRSCSNSRVFFTNDFRRCFLGIVVG